MILTLLTPMDEAMAQAYADFAACPVQYLDYAGNLQAVDPKTPEEAEPGEWETSNAR